MFNMKENGTQIGEPFEDVEEARKCVRQYFRSGFFNENQRIEIWWDDEVSLYYQEGLEEGLCVVDTKFGPQPGITLMRMRKEDWVWDGGPNREMTFQEKEFISE